MRFELGIHRMKVNAVVLILTFVSLVGEASCGYAEDEQALLDTLRSNYSIDHRPSKITHVTVAVSIFALNSLDIGAETMSLSSVVINAWQDYRLTWNPADYSGIEDMVIPTKYVWKPPLLVENEVSKVAVMGSEGAPLRISANGMVAWIPPVSSTTSCSVDITYYPYDTQTCSLTIVGWSYTTDEVNLLTDPDKPIATNFYSENGEWDLLGTGVDMVNLTQDGSSFRKIQFKFTFRRKWEFYGQNLIIPLVLNSLLMAMVFVVPIESGEKMGYCLTVLLSYIVLLTMVSENLPSISSQTSIIQIYLTGVMCIGTLGTICTIIILRLTNKDDDKQVPNSLQLFTRYFVAPLTCTMGRSAQSSKAVTPLTKEFAAELDKASRVYTYKEIAVLMDSLFFRIFASLMLFCTIAFLTSINHDY